MEDRVSRTQYQYTLEDTDAKELNIWTDRLVDKLRDVAFSCETLTTDQENGGLETELVVDRDTASRLGISLSGIDNTLYDSFGQRLVSTMFTQLNQYHVVLGVQPAVRR